MAVVNILNTKANSTKEIAEFSFGNADVKTQFSFENADVKTHLLLQIDDEKQSVTFYRMC